MLAFDPPIFAKLLTACVAQAFLPVFWSSLLRSRF
jgi:hypothetical protein